MFEVDVTTKYDILSYTAAEKPAITEGVMAIALTDGNVIVWPLHAFECVEIAEITTQ